MHPCLRARDSTKYFFLFRHKKIRRLLFWFREIPQIFFFTYPNEMSSNLISMNPYYGGTPPAARMSVKFDKCLYELASSKLCQNRLKRNWWESWHVCVCPHCHNLSSHLTLLAVRARDLQPTITSNPPPRKNPSKVHWKYPLSWFYQ